jgi:hypothetical protein
MKKLQSATSGKHLKRVRRICAGLPESIEKLSHGEPTFFVRKKVFCMFANNHHNDGHIAVWLPAPFGIQEMLIGASPEKFFKPPYVGVRGWIGVELARVSDEELDFLMRQSWRMIAPKKLQAALATSVSKTEKGVPAKGSFTKLHRGDAEYAEMFS